MTEEAYGFCNSKCKHPIYTKDDYFILTGEVTVKSSGNTLNSIVLSYPDGLKEDNCVPISFGVKREDSTYGFNYSICDGYVQTGDIAGFGRYLALETKRIVVGLHLIPSQYGMEIGDKVLFKIVLMKVGE